jgi:hypothetical protein
MKRSFELSHHRWANVWPDEALPAAYTVSSVVRKVLRPTVAIDEGRMIAGVEVRIPHGLIAPYALLGAELVEAEVDGLEVIVFVNEVGAWFPESLAGQSGDVKIGLPDEYANAVINGVAKAAEAVGAPARRKLRFGRAAHGVVNSPHWVFEKASGIVLRLLMLPAVDLDDQVDGLLG